MFISLAKKYAVWNFFKCATMLRFNPAWATITKCCEQTTTCSFKRKPAKVDLSSWKCLLLGLQAEPIALIV